MKLSDAIRNGAKMHPKGIMTYFSAGGSCAMGAAWVAMGNAYGGRVSPKWINEHVNCLGGVRCPECGTYGNMFHIIGDHLNDTHGWSREAIAEWVETVEKKLETAGERREEGINSVSPAVPEELSKDCTPVEVK